MGGEALNILLIEDDPDHADLILDCLKENRIANDVFHVADGEAALDFLLRQGKYADADKSPTPHLVLLDLRLPKVDGLEVLRRIKADDTLKRIPVVVLTTSDAEIDVTRAYDLHANSYLMKPVNFESFNGMIRDLDFYWLVWNRTAKVD
jgi:CheY-like chemotaxis protein